MKLHLPKALLSVAVAMVSVGMADATSLTLDLVKGSKEYSNNLTVGSGEYVGALESGTLVDGDFSNTRYTQSLMLRETSGRFILSYDYKDLTISGTGRVVVAGKQDSNTYSGITAGKITVNGDNSTDNLIASSLLVKQLEITAGNVLLHTDFGGHFCGGNAFIGYMPISSVGTLFDADASKMVVIKEKLNVTGGTLTIGSSSGGYGVQTDANGNKQYHFQSGFEGSINQSGGTIAVHDMSLMAGNISITQSAGSMSLSATGANKVLAFNSDGTATITQDGKAEMTLGKLSAYNKNGNPTKNSVAITQNGDGVINLTQGVDYESSNGKASSITQNGGGTVNLNGDFTSVKFNLTQTDKGEKASINIGTVDENDKVTTAFVKSGNVTQSAGHFITINGKSELTADSISIAGTLENNGTINKTDGNSLLEIVGGKVENNGTIKMNISMTGGELTAADGSTFADITATSGTIYLGDVLTLGTLTLGGDAIATATFDLRSQQNGVTVYVCEGGVQVDNLKIMGDNVTFVAKTNGTLADISAPITLFKISGNGTEYDLGNAKLVIEDSTGEQTEVAFKDNDDGTVTVTGAIPEPTTATLSLLALAALAARRRRK